MNRTGQIVLSLVIWGLVGAGYLLYRHSVSSPSQVTHYITSALPIAPTACTSSGTLAFEGSVHGILYFDKARMRAQVTKVNQGATAIYHAISEDGRKVHVWQDEKRGSVVSMQEFNSEFNITGSALTCGPWWSPDTSYFDLPVFTSFSQ